MPDPILYGPHFSTYVRSARLALEEKGVAYRLEEPDVFSDPKAKAAHLARHPFGKIPAFEHDDFAFYETGAIMRYVDEAFPGPSLQPSKARDRARMTQVLGIVDSYAYPSWITSIVIPRHRAAQGVAADETAIEEAVPLARTCVETLDKFLENKAYFAGDDISLADLHVAPLCFYFTQFPEGQRLFGHAANLTRWWTEISTRPSIVKTTPVLTD
ncbi:MAG: glutathione S-transferase family protein [Alphaproteobacteria bacterium]